MTKSNISIIEPVCAHGGMDYYLFPLMRSLKRQGHVVRLYTSKIGVLPHEDLDIKEHFKGVYGKTPAFFRGLIWIFALYRSLIDARRFKADIVHFHLFGYDPIVSFSIQSAKLFGFKLVTTVHDVESFLAKHQNKKMSKLLSKVDGIIVHNETSRIELIKLLNQRALKIANIKNGNYLGFIEPRVPKKKCKKILGIDSKKKILLFFGQIKKVKALDTAIKALGVLKLKDPNVLLLVAGKVLKDDIEKYKLLIKELGVEKNVRLDISYIPPEKVKYYYYASDVILLPYRKIYFSGVLFMSMSYGMPVVVSDLPAFKEFIKNGKNGIVFPVDDFRALAAGVLKITNNAQFSKKIGGSAKKFMRDFHSWDDVGKTTSNYYESLYSSSVLKN